ncbi:MAG TPA: transposase [Clostridiaceae bacterium]|nr:transposase [Clostridiaceae bacterium]
MYCTVQMKLIPDHGQEVLIENTLNSYIATVNSIVADFISKYATDNRTSADVSANMPSALKNQAIQDARSVFKKYAKDLNTVCNINKKNPLKKQKITKVPILKKPVAIWNNQNYSLGENTISFPVWKERKSKKLTFRVVATEYQKSLLQNKLGTLRITKKRGKYMAQISVEIHCDENEGNSVLGIDLGLKIPAVAITDSNKIKFFGNGRENKYKKRVARSKRKALSKAKNMKALRNRSNKEQRWMKDKDHKVSREIVKFAKQNNVKVIHMEELSGIRQTARTSRKNAKNLHTWSFYRLARFIEYKASLAGIEVIYVNPRYTSQTCPVCGARNHASDRKYMCPCGFKTHRDILGAMNIVTAPVIGGNSLSA